MKYVNVLIDYRWEIAQRNGWKFGFYHKEFYSAKAAHPTFLHERRKKILFSSCLHVTNKKGGPIDGENACYIQLERQELQ